MPFLLGILGLGMALLFWALRTHSTVKAVQELNSDTKGMQRRVGQGLATIFGTRLKRVNDPRLAAVILMIQLVRTGSPVTAQEKTQILELMEHPLQIANVSAMFEKAWTYTEPRSFFSQTSDELLALLRQQLDAGERSQFIDMLTKVANAYSDASDLQVEGIARFKKRLLAI